MAVYIVRRLLLAVGVVFGVSLITFILAYLVPADPARVYAGSNATAQTVAHIRAQLGLDRPLARAISRLPWPRRARRLRHVV